MFQFQGNNYLFCFSVRTATLLLSTKLKASFAGMLPCPNNTDFIIIVFCFLLGRSDISSGLFDFVPKVDVTIVML